MCVCVCVCVYIPVKEEGVCVCACVCVYIPVKEEGVCVCVCVCLYSREGRECVLFVWWQGVIYSYTHPVNTIAARWIASRHRAALRYRV